MSERESTASLRFEAIVFDFDGVILESAQIKTRAFELLFAAAPEYVDAIRDYHLANVGISRFKKFEWVYETLFKRPLSAPESQDLGEQFSKIVKDQIAVCPFVPGAKEALEALSGRLPLYVASGTPQAELEDTIAVRGLTSYFTQVWGSPRPKAEVLAEVSSKTPSMDPLSVLMVGDGDSDFAAASREGTRFLARQTDEYVGSWSAQGVEAHADLHKLVQFVSAHED